MSRRPDDRGGGACSDPRGHANDISRANHNVPTGAEPNSDRDAFSDPHGHPDDISRANHNVPTGAEPNSDRDAFSDPHGHPDGAPTAATAKRTPGDHQGICHHPGN
jgi:hypothetical protein